MSVLQTAHNKYNDLHTSTEKYMYNAYTGYP